MPQTTLVLFSALALFLPSQPPTPTPTESAYKNQGKAAPEKPKANPDQNGSESSPSSGNKSAAEVAGGNQQQPTHNRAQKTTPDWWSVTSTALNTIFTGLLVWLMFRQWRAMHRQAEYMRDGLGETRKAADAATSAAETAARALAVQTRPWIGLGKNGIHSDLIVIDHRGWISTFVTTTIENFGNHPALVRSSAFAELVVGDIADSARAVSERLNQHMEDVLPGGYGPSHAVFPGGSATRVNSTFVTPERIVGKPNESNLVAYLVGGITYTDSLGNIHHTGFSYLYQVVGSVPQAVVFELLPGSTVPAGAWVEHSTLVD